MTENKRYEIVFLNGLDGLCSIQDNEAEIPTFYNDLGYVNHIKPVCDLLNELSDENERLNHLVKIATSLIEWNTIPQIRREWQKHLNEVGDVDD